jgi:hypothetical protein
LLGSRPTLPLFLVNYFFSLQWLNHVENDINSEFAFESSDDNNETKTPEATNGSLFCPFLGFEKQGQGAQVQRQSFQK